MFRFRSTVSLLCVSQLVSAADSPVEARFAAGLAAIQAKVLSADLHFLASDALEGRMSLQRGSDVAMQWVAAEFAKAGLRPLVGESYVQPITLLEFRVDNRASRLTVNRDGTKTFGYG